MSGEAGGEGAAEGEAAPEATPAAAEEGEEGEGEEGPPKPDYSKNSLEYVVTCSGQVCILPLCKPQPHALEFVLGKIISCLWLYGDKEPNSIDDLHCCPSAWHVCCHSSQCGILTAIHNGPSADVYTHDRNGC